MGTVDRHLLRWIGDDDAPPSPAAGHGDATSTIRAWLDRRGAVAAVAASATGQSPVLRALVVAPGWRDPSSTATPIGLLDVLEELRLWLFRHPDQVEAHHIAATTRMALLLAVTGGRISSQEPDETIAGWREAAEAFRGIAVPLPPTQDRRFRVLRHITEALRTSAPDPTTIADATQHLPALAEALEHAARRALFRGVLFIKETGLDDRSHGGVYHAVVRWSAAFPLDPAIRQLLAGLTKAARPVTAGRRRASGRQTFPPLKGSQPSAVAPVPQPGRLTRGRGRT
jgi:hypothetical protein